MSSDYELEDTLYLPFTTRAFATGIPTALVSGVVDIYEDVTATPIVTAETLAVTLNGHAGFNMITVTATAASGFEAGKSYTAILDAGTVSSVSVIGEVVAHFTIGKSAAAKDLANGTDGLGAIKAETALIKTEADKIALADAGAGVAGSVIEEVENRAIPTDIVSAGAITTSSGAVSNVTTVATTTTNTDMRGTENAALASVVGALADAAAAGDPTAADTMMQYVKQLINTLEGAVGIPIFPAESAPGNNVSLAEVIRAMAVDVAGLNGDVMRGTDGVDPATMRGTDGVDTATMRGTDSAALASVLGTLADAAAAGDPTAIDTIMQYVKQLVNLLAGSAGIGTMPAGLDPANGVNLFEMLRASMGATFAQATDSLEQLQADHVTLQSDTDDIQARLPAALVSGRMDSDVAVIQTDAISAAAMSAAAAQKIRDEILPTQNVALSNIEFLFVATSDHVTPVTGASGTGVTRSIDGGAFGAGTGTLAEVGNGIYQYDASQADMNGGIITFRFIGTGGTPGAPDDVFLTIVTGGGV